MEIAVVKINKKLIVDGKFAEYEEYSLVKFSVISNVLI